MSEWVIEREPHRCGHRFATYEAHMAHAIYKDKRLVRCLEPMDCGLFFDGVEWTHIPPAPRDVALDQKVTLRPARPARGKVRTCRECGTIIEPTGKRGRPAERCDPCRGK